MIGDKIELRKSISSMGINKRLLKTIKSNERSEDSYKGLADFFFQEQSYISLITTDVDSYILMHL